MSELGTGENVTGATCTGIACGGGVGGGADLQPAMSEATAQASKGRTQRFFAVWDTALLLQIASKNGHTWRLQRLSTEITHRRWRSNSGRKLLRINALHLNNTRISV